MRRCRKGLVACVVGKNEGESAGCVLLEGWRLFLHAGRHTCAARFAQEWVAYHHYAGYEHLYIYLNNVEDETMEALQPFVEVSLHLTCCISRTQTESSSDLSSHGLGGLFNGHHRAILVGPRRWVLLQSRL
jgi:hypothetical protein